jgi:NAD+ synthase/NAD+ synthase (glutamine-hydrolysing)
MLHIALAQLNLTVGDLEGNVRLMIASAQRAWEHQADMIVFPELSLTGYYPADLLDDPQFLQRCEAAYHELLLASRQMPHLHWVVGLPIRHDGPGHGLHNGLRVLKGGETLLTYAKQLLPTYNVFDERRHFDAGPEKTRLLKVRGVRVGFLICEDGWNDHGDSYLANPFERLRDAAPDLVVSINASPSNIGKRQQRHEVLGQAARRHGLPLLYVNHVGGHDQLVYDGASFAVEASGRMAFEAQRFVEDHTVLRFDQGQFLLSNGLPPPAVPREGLPRAEFYRRQIVLGLRDYARRCGFKDVVVGSSGGIDSALTLALAVQALGAGHVHAVTMPSRWSSNGSVDDSAQLCERLGVTLHTHPIADLVAQYAHGFESAFGTNLKGLALENVQARIRGTILMEYSNQFGPLLLTTGNKSEISVGYCTLYGDTNGGLGLIGDLYKTEVFALSRHLNQEAGQELIPNAIIDKPPSAELAPGQRDSDSLPPYEVLDEVLKWEIEGHRLGPDEYPAVAAYHAQLQTTAEGRALMQRVRQLIARSEYKRRQAPPVIRLRARAFGSGRQMPVAANYS